MFVLYLRISIFCYLILQPHYIWMVNTVRFLHYVNLITIVTIWWIILGTGPTCLSEHLPERKWVQPGEASYYQRPLGEIQRLFTFFNLNMTIISTTVQNVSITDNESFHLLGLVCVVDSLGFDSRKFVGFCGLILIFKQINNKTFFHNQIFSLSPQQNYLTCPHFKSTPCTGPKGWC